MTTEAAKKAWATRRASERERDMREVAGIVGERYTNRAKRLIRAWVIAEIKSCMPTLVLDFWGGGASADEMTAAGLTVLSVDHAKGFTKEFGINAARARRALTTAGILGGYRTAWGEAVRFARECDAAWLDFMGHLSPSAILTLKACAHMKVLVVTLMAERVAGMDHATPETWTIMYTAAIEKYSGLSVKSVRKYSRPNGQWVLVFVARKNTGTYLKERDAKRQANPEYRAQRNAYQREWRAKNHERTLARQRARSADPTIQAKRKADYKKQRADPEWTAKRREYTREWARRRAEAERHSEG